MDRPVLRVLFYAVCTVTLFSEATADSQTLRLRNAESNSRLLRNAKAHSQLPDALPHHRYVHLVDQYLYTMRMSITGALLRTPSVPVGGYGNLQDTKPIPYDNATRTGGLDWPLYGYTMVGLLRLHHIDAELVRLEEQGVKGDFVECGVWRGGASIYAKAVVSSYHMFRKVILVDSFEGLPPSANAVDNDRWNKMEYLKVSLDTVKQHFEMYRLLDEYVEFYKGYFNVSTPVLAKDLSSGGGIIAYLRMDGDMYESTMDQLFNLYEFVTVGGVVCVDDWTIPEAQKAVKEFLEMHNAVETISPVDSASAFWVKSVNFKVKREWYDAFNKKRFGNE